VVAPREDDARAIAVALESLPVRLLDPLLLESQAGDPEALLGQLEAQAPDAVVVAGGARTGDHGPTHQTRITTNAAAPPVALSPNRPHGVFTRSIPTVRLPDRK